MPIDINDFFVDLFYYFDKSAKRKEELKEFQSFTGTDELKHCKTRWLSLEKAVQRVVQQWPALLCRISEVDIFARVQDYISILTVILQSLFCFFLSFLWSVCPNLM